MSPGSSGVSSLRSEKANSVSLRSTHSLRRISQTHHIAYYLSPASVAKYTDQKLARLEQEIEQVYIADLKQNCKQERSLRECFPTQEAGVEISGMRV